MTSAEQDILTFAPLTPSRWGDFEALFGPRGACAGCWCMWWVLSRKDFESGKGQANHDAMKARIDGGEVPGLLAYAGEQPVGWCAVGPRDEYSRLGRSRILKPVDEAPVWSIVCFFVRRDYRGRGVSRRLIDAAVDYAASRGADIIEAYPVEPRQGRAPDAFVWTGLAAAFRHSGFSEVARRSPTRPIMRRRIRD